MKKIFLLVILSSVVFSAMAQLPALPPRPNVDPTLAPFYHGVASGDPLADRVIIWTRVTPTVVATYSVDWQVATDSLFTHIVNFGTATTDSSVDYTVKVDVTGLSANTWYYYHFIAGGPGGKVSLCGRTKTLPVGNVDSIRIAVSSCSDFEAGYFNAYNSIANRNDISAFVHLGDWYYEYGAGGSGASGDTSRYHPFTRDALYLSDYRLWQSQYHLDQDLRAMLEEYPLIAVWDDHESANNSYYLGAQNHNPATQGSWFTRKNAAKKAYFEWMPIRPLATGNDTIIHRNFNFGKLFNLVMLDTRLEGRDSSLGVLIPLTNAYLSDTNRQMLGPVQLAWMKTQLSDTSTQWKIIGNQVMISPLELNIILTTEILNGDQWDGYPAERNRVFKYISQNRIKDVVFVSGDIHSSWANDLPSVDSTYNATTGAGSVATEMIGTSITSTANVAGTAGAIMAFDNWVKYIDFTHRGYLLFDVNKTRAQGDFIHISGDATRTYTTSDDAQWVNLDGERHLRTGTAPLATVTNTVPLVTPFPVGTSGLSVKQTENNDMIVFNCYPNPVNNEINVQYYLNQESKLRISIMDINGNLVYATTTDNMPKGVSIATISTDGFAKGIYVVNLSSGNSNYSYKIIKSN